MSGRRFTKYLEGVSVPHCDRCNLAKIRESEGQVCSLCTSSAKFTSVTKRDRRSVSPVQVRSRAETYTAQLNSRK